VPSVRGTWCRHGAMTSVNHDSGENSAGEFDFASLASSELRNRRRKRQDRKSKGGRKGTKEKRKGRKEGRKRKKRMRGTRVAHSFRILPPPPSGVDRGVPDGAEEEEEEEKKKAEGSHAPGAFFRNCLSATVSRPPPHLARPSSFIPPSRPRKNR